MKKALSLILALIMALSLVACGGDKGDSDAPAASGNDKPGTSEEAAEAKSLRVVMDTLLGNADPTSQTGISPRLFYWQVYEGLIHFDEKTGEVSGRVADSWEYADDMSYVDFHINPDVTFHDGSKVTAEDILFSYDYHDASGMFVGDLQNFTDWEIIDEETFRIYLAGATTIPMLSVSVITILSKANVEAAGADAFTTPETSIGTGAYKFAEMDFDGTTVIEAYADYFRGEADIKTVEWVYLTDTSTSLVAFQTGEFDFIKLPTANVKEMEASGQYNVIHAASTHNSFLGLNVQVIKDPLVRQAILYAVNNEQIMNAAYDGLGVVSSNMAETGMVGGGYSFDDYYDYNPEKAVELLKQAGYTQAELDAGVPMGNIVAMSTNYYSKVATIVQEMLMQVGLKFEVTTFEQATVEDLWYTQHSTECAIVCHGDNIMTDSVNFYTFYPLRDQHRPDVWGYSEKLYELGGAAAAEYDDTARNELWKEFWTELKDSAVYYSLFHRDNMYISTKEVNPVMGVNYYRFYDWSWN